MNCKQRQPRTYGEPHAGSSAIVDTKPQACSRCCSGLKTWRKSTFRTVCGYAEGLRMTSRSSCRRALKYVVGLRAYPIRSCRRSICVDAMGKDKERIQEPLSMASPSCSRGAMLQSSLAAPRLSPRKTQAQRCRGTPLAGDGGSHAVLERLRRAHITSRLKGHDRIPVRKSSASILR